MKNALTFDIEEYFHAEVFAHALRPDEWGNMWQPREADGTPIAVDDLPLTVAFATHRPGHRPMIITGSDGVDRSIAVTAYPLLDTVDHLAGAIAIFWEEAQ